MDAFKIYIERFEKPVNWMVYDQQLASAK